MGASSGNGKGLITSINVTPLVDVVLVLLIIFMATAPLIHRRALNINVPKAAHSEAKATRTFQILYSAERELMADNESYDWPGLEAELRKRYLLEPALHVAVSADEVIPYGEVVELLDLIRGTGVKKVALEIQPKSSG